MPPTKPKQCNSPDDNSERQNVSFKNGLAISYAKLAQFSLDQLNDAPTARGYFEQAEKLWVELVRDAPQYAQFQRFLEQVQQDLAGLE